MRKIKTNYAIIILIIILGLSITIRRTCERFYFGKEESCIYYNNCKIKSEKDSCTYIYSGGINESGNTDIKFKFSGVDTIWNINSKEEANVIFKYSSEIEYGDFKVVIINPDTSISKIVDNSQEGELSYLIHPGKTKVKIVGNKASGRLKLNLSYNEKEKLIDVFSAFI